MLHYSNTRVTPPTWHTHSLLLLQFQITSSRVRMEINFWEDGQRSQPSIALLTSVRPVDYGPLVSVRQRYGDKRAPMAHQIRKAISLQTLITFLLSTDVSWMEFFRWATQSDIKQMENSAQVCDAKFRAFLSISQILMSGLIWPNISAIRIKCQWENKLSDTNRHEFIRDSWKEIHALFIFVGAIVFTDANDFSWYFQFVSFVPFLQ